MAEERKFYLTKEGIERVKKEYKELTSARLAKARGEIPKIWESESLNSEYLSFQEDIGFLDSRITELNHILKNLVLIEIPSKEKRNIVNLGAQVKVELDGEIDEFTIVDPLETDPANKKISNESPIGRALIGKRIGETLVIKTPIVNHSCRIVKIKYNKS